MDDLEKHRQKIDVNGFTVIDNIYSPAEIINIIEKIERADQNTPFFRKSSDLFAIRQFLKHVPEIKEAIFNDKLKVLIHHLFGAQYFVTKSIYFDKPEKSNWFVAWHQDLTIAVDKKAELPGYTNWTLKQNRYAVQPPVKILHDNFTVRIHLDDTDDGNGALRVVPGTHLKEIYRVEHFVPENEQVCAVKAGGVMIMRPLLMHASNRSSTNKKRRVIHIEFSDTELPAAIHWAEKE
jgi:ectoine hydroxylase-related dioxygenase (phytanoyl-CoA dioxygenase family)